MIKVNQPTTKVAERTSLGNDGKTPGASSPSLNTSIKNNQAPLSSQLTSPPPPSVQINLRTQMKSLLKEQESEEIESADSEEKIEQLKSQIEAGTLKINAEVIAKEMIKKAKDEIAFARKTHEE